jgi:hypothetical protein
MFDDRVVLRLKPLAQKLEASTISFRVRIVDRPADASSIREVEYKFIAADIGLGLTSHGTTIDGDLRGCRLRLQH